MKPRVRMMSDGTFFRMWPGGFGAVFTTGPYETVKQAASLKDFYAAAYACGYSVAGDRK